MEKDKKSILKYKDIIIVALIIIVMYKLINNFEGTLIVIGSFIHVIAPVLFGILLGYLLHIPANKIQRAFKNSKIGFFSKRSKGLSVLTTFIIVLLVLTIIVNVILPVVKQSILELVTNYQSYYEAAMRRYNNLPQDSIFKSEIVNEIIINVQKINIRDYINLELITAYAKGAINLAMSLFDLFVVIVVSVYVLLEKEKIVEFFNKLVERCFKEKIAENIKRYINNSNVVFYNFLAGQILDAIIVGILVTIAMKIIGVKYALLLGFMIALFNLIPYFGAIIAVFIAIIITIITGGFSQAILMALIVIILQQIDANIINPKILGNSLKISPIIVILSVIIGGAYFGVVGMFLAVPFAAVLKIIISDYVNSPKKRELV